jgi:hypothetical protein
MGLKRRILRALGGIPKSEIRLSSPPTLELSADVRRKKAELRRIMVDIELEEARQQLAEMRQSGVIDNPDGLFMNLISNAFQARGAQNNNIEGFSINTPPSPAGEPPKLQLTRPQIKAFIDGLPPTQKALIKYASDEQLRGAIKEKIPLISDESLDLCVQIARE